MILVFLKRGLLFTAYYVRGHSHIDVSHVYCQNDANSMTHPPTSLNVKTKNMLKIDENHSFLFQVSQHTCIAFRCSEGKR